jgi:hypothetical protein
LILHPGLTALVLASTLICLMAIYSSYYGLRILKSWDLRSGSEVQLALERRTYLISTVMVNAFAFELASLFLLIYTAENLHTLFVGAMCAAGTLYANPFGYPALILKLVVSILGGIWLIINSADQKAHDYPLIKIKYTLLLVITPLAIAETVLLISYLINLRADIITSCCGALFSGQARPSARGFLNIPSGTVLGSIFYLSVSLTILSGLYFYFKNRWGYPFSILSAATLIVSIASLIIYISPYFYELPTHRCPFCILQREYNYVGYLLYGSVLCGSLAGMGVGALEPFRNVLSLKPVVPPMQRRLALASVVLYVLFGATVILRMLTTDFRP